MISPWGGLWLLSVAGLALLFGVVAAGLRQDMALCAAMGGLQAGLDRLASPVRLSHAMAGLRGADLLVGLACLMPLGVLAARSWGRRQWVLVTATIGFAAMLFAHLAREYGGGCVPFPDRALMLYLFPAALLSLLAWRIAETLADRAGQ